METITFNIAGLLQSDIDTIVKNTQDTFDYIISDARNRYEHKKQLEDKLKEWSRAFCKELKKYNIKCYNTSYSNWECGNNYYTISVPYVLPSYNEDRVFRSSEDFNVVLSTPLRYKEGDRRYISHEQYYISYHKTVDSVMKEMQKLGLNI